MKYGYKRIHFCDGNNNEEMKNSSLRLAASVAVFLLGIVSKAQTTINFGIVNNLQVVSVEAMVKDAETSEPVDFASAYITKQNDTTMCSFGLTNQGKTPSEL